MVRIVLMGGRCTDLMILMQTKGNIYMLMQKEICAGPMLKEGKMGYIGPMLKEGNGAASIKVGGYLPLRRALGVISSMSLLM